MTARRGNLAGGFWLVRVGAACLVSTLACGSEDASPNGPSGGAASGGTQAGVSGGTAGAPGAQAGAAGVAGGAPAMAGQSGGAGDFAGAGAGGSSGSAQGGSGGVAGSGLGGSAGGGGVPTTPSGPNVTAAKARHEHRFRAKDADAAVSFNDNSEIAVIDNRAPKLVGKLVLPFGGVGTNAGTLEAGGEFCARRGFHVLGVAAFQDYDIVSKGADFFGDARRTVFEGVLHTREGEFASIPMTRADGVAQRTQKALEYLQAKFPDEGWGYYLDEAGAVRWSDVIFSGFSHGGSNALRFAFLVGAARAVSLSAPRDNLCTTMDMSSCGGVVATWLSETPKTAKDRFFAITGKSDDQHLQHLFTMAKVGYSGTATSIQGAEPPYGDSHRLIADAAHTDFCQSATYQKACNYVFGVPTENQAGVPN